MYEKNVNFELKCDAKGNWERDRIGRERIERFICKFKIIRPRISSLAQIEYSLPFFKFGNLDAHDLFVDLSFLIHIIIIIFFIWSLRSII